ncbi:MAG: hypothetical protein AO396_06220 [Candidatus Fermentibacter daniensis]|nr:MAG: hypothetical protein AO396_06220 [Candidatus Fermentibacter daniensis]KZD17138.1 MAG: hypothetical protein AO395_02395 [Candidatus Fermentibacter daniensis]KZD19560.1 MAG: hypothetical protein AO394_02110 [Candidatus Fermentibacter daniensis]
MLFIVGGSFVDVIIERNGFRPYCEDQVVGMLRSLKTPGAKVRSPLQCRLCSDGRPAISP